MPKKGGRHKEKGVATESPTAASFCFPLPFRSDPRFQDLLRRMNLSQ